MTRLVWDHYWKVRNQKCCASQCDFCPYTPKHKGGMVSEGAVRVEPWILEQMNMFAVENAPNAEFARRYTDANEIVIRLKHWKNESRPFTVKPATKKDFMLYFGYVQ